MNIELDQGVDHLGRVFGYDHKRKNYITWIIRNGKIVVQNVEHDDQEEKHGSIRQTRREATAEATKQNKLPNSSLRRSIVKGFQRD